MKKHRLTADQISKSENVIVLPYVIAIAKSWTSTSTRHCIMLTEAYSELSQTSVVELFAKIVNDFHSLTVFAKKLHLKCSTVLNTPLVGYCILNIKSLENHKYGIRKLLQKSWEKENKKHRYSKRNKWLKSPPWIFIAHKKGFECISIISKAKKIAKNLFQRRSYFSWIKKKFYWLIKNLFTFVRSQW